MVSTVDHSFITLFKDYHDLDSALPINFGSHANSLLFPYYLI